MRKEQSPNSNRFLSKHMPCIIQIGKIKGDEFHIPTTPPFSLELRQTELPGKFLYNAAAASYTFHIV
jgi:hypothetical protein